MNRPIKKVKVNALEKCIPSKSLSELQYFNDLCFFVLPVNFGATRLKLFKSQIERHGGKVVTDMLSSIKLVTHTIVEESVQIEKILKLVDVSLVSDFCIIVKCTWLSKCIKAKQLVDYKDDEIYIPKKMAVAKTCTSTIKRNIIMPKEFTKPSTTTMTDDVETSNISSPLLNSIKQQPELTSESVNILSIATTSMNKTMSPGYTACNQQINLDIFEHSQKVDLKLKCTNEELYSDHHVEHHKTRLQDRFVCAHASSGTSINVNKHITDELAKLSASYKTKKDTWRAVGYERAIAAIRNYPKEITTWEEAKNIRGVGERLADKVAEIIESGMLRKVKEVCEGEEALVLQLFTGVWGAGPSTAQKWYTQGFRTLEDLRTKGNLTKHQEIGLRYYDDLNDRIPRNEVVEIEDQVRSGALQIQSGLTVMVCGSYRRGRTTCGDVDVLITHPNGHSHQNVFTPLLQLLKSTGFITDDLVISKDGNQQKYLGVCLLPGTGKKHRRLDIIVVPYSEVAAASLYFTGSAHFNRSMRLLAVKMGMSLSEHGLRTNIVRKGREKLTDGQLLDTPTEESVFKELGLKYRAPNERDH